MQKEINVLVLNMPSKLYLFVDSWPTPNAVIDKRQTRKMFSPSVGHYAIAFNRIYWHFFAITTTNTYLCGLKSSGFGLNSCITTGAITVKCNMVKDLSRVKINLFYGRDQTRRNFGDTSPAVEQL
jgi:hypothetical protein